MATYEKAQTAPFGAISVYRSVAALDMLVQDIEKSREARRSVAELRKLSPRDLDDIGLSFADVQRVFDAQPSLWARTVAWFGDRIAAIQTAHELSRLSDRQLDDIGLTQAEVADYNRRARFF